MTAAEDVTSGTYPIGALPARATMLAAVSRLVLAATVLSAVWAALTVRPEASPAGDRVGPVPVLARVAVEDRVGTTMAGLLRGLDATLSGSAARLHQLEVGAPDGVQVPVGVVIELPSGGPAAVEQLILALEVAGLDGVLARSVTPVPGGVRIDIDARARLGSLGPMQGPAVFRPATVALAETVARSGASLRHLEVPAEADGPIRMEVRGDLATIAVLLAELEEHHTAPLRFLRLDLRADTDDVLEVRLAFRQSVPVPSSDVAEVP